MKKSDKKIENQLRKVLTEVCEVMQTRFTDYQWITHSVNYRDFPKTLLISCAFDSQQSIEEIKGLKQDIEIKKIITEHLLSINIKLLDTHKQVKLIVA